MKLRQENSILREQLSSSLNQIAEFSVKCNRLKTKLTEFSFHLNHQKNRYHQIKELYQQVKKEFRILQEKGRQEGYDKIQELGLSVLELQNDYEHVLNLLHAENMNAV